MSEQKLSRRQFIAGAGSAALSLHFLSSVGVSADGKRPNFVFILTDDQRHDAMSCAGHPFLRTPNIDRIANEGARFRNAFVTIALCAPSRGCFLTGRYAHSHGVTDNKTPLDDALITFPRALRNAGYDTAYVGKWHMDVQEGPRPGFSRWVSFKGQGAYTNPVLNVDGETVRSTGYMTDLLTRYAVDWLKQPRTKPFCLYLAHKAVHGPFQPALRHSRLFSDVSITRPASSSENASGRPEWFRKRQQTHPDRMSDERFAEFIRNCCRTVVGIDDSVGRVLETLEGLGELDNTVVVFAGDNGFFHGEHGMLDKRAMYEESIRIPLVMRYPRLIRAGTLVDDMVLNIDLCPTLLDLAGEKPPAGVQGMSWKPLLTGSGGPWREDWLYEYFFEPAFATPAIRGVRTRRWKYVTYPDNDYPVELYDLSHDPNELENLANEPSSAKVLEDMKKRLERLLRETGRLKPMKINRLPHNPIITPDMDARMGSNINGPSLIRVPEWAPDPLGRYYLYFAHHKGDYIRLAYSDTVEGPWRIHEPGTLQLGESRFSHHIASPDVHVDHDRREIRMYYHGVEDGTGQMTRVALSSDGLRFTAREEILGVSYFRVFRWGGWWYALAMPGIFYRSKDGLTGFERGPKLFTDDMRHSALKLEVSTSTLSVFYSNVGDCPERMVLSTIDLAPDWMQWKATEPVTVLEPEMEWEGANLPLEPSIRGWAPEPVRQLRDPAIFREEGRTYLLYSVAGEHGIAIAEVGVAEIEGMFPGLPLDGIRDEEDRF